jgi:hypothetical protein
LIIIIAVARSRSAVQKKKQYKEQLRGQFRQYRHFIITPILLVILAVPRAVIAFTVDCMKSARNPWLFLMGYFTSFMPPLLTFIIFILPSEMYKKE